MTNPGRDLRRAVIDVGTNSVKLLVGDLSGSEIIPVHEESRQTRLGAGFYQTGHLQQSAIDQTAAAIADFARTAAELGSAAPRVIGTSAARDAANISALKTAVRETSGLDLQVLSGAQEAEWVFRGVTTDSRLAPLALLITDVGGGSTEFIVGEKSESKFSNSYPLGSVRLLEQLRLPDPPGVEQLEACRSQLRKFLDTNVRHSIRPALDACASPLSLAATGGTATILARMQGRMETFDRARIEDTVLTGKDLSGHVQALWSMPMAERQKIPGLPPNRADVILTGAAILEAIMRTFSLNEMRVSTRGLRYWALMA
jgi:exopolyphosphatase/guanosine-5'-triphosphate,3'-diphosphate pyrophosphatase